MIIRNPQNMQALSLNRIEPCDIDKDEVKQIQVLLDDMEFGGVDSLCLEAKKEVMLTDEFENSFSQACFKALKKLNYSFFYALNTSFITSNVPVCVGDDLIIAEKDKTSIFLALSPKVAVIFGNYKNSCNFKNQMVCIGEKQVESFNRIFLKHSDSKRFLIVNSDDVIRKYVEIAR